MINAGRRGSEVDEVTRLDWGSGIQTTGRNGKIELPVLTDRRWHKTSTGDGERRERTSPRDELGKALDEIPTPETYLQTGLENHQYK